MKPTNRHLITKQPTAKQRKWKQFVLPVYLDLKANPDIQTNIIKDKLFIKGQLRTKYLTPKPATANGTDTTIKLVADDMVKDSRSAFHMDMRPVKST